MLAIKNVNQYYGGSHILRDVSLEAKAGRGHGGPGPQRRRQDDAAEVADGPGAIKTGSIEFDGRAIQATRPTSAPAPASASCRRAARSSRA